MFPKVWFPSACAVLVLGLALCGCGPQQPLKVGFIGGLSSRSTDIGEAGRNGVVLALEQLNRNGGIGGRQVELVVRDDAQDAAVAERGARELAEAGVAAVIGPFTSGMAAAIVPVLAERQVLVISPTVTAMAFHGQDDNLVRINRTTRDNAEDYAALLYRRGLRRLAVAYDLRNRSFSESWLQEFRRAFSNQGGALSGEVAYTSGPDTDFAQVVQGLRQARPDGLFFIASAIDVARLAQQARRQAPELPIAASEWAASEQLLELGGKVIDGLLVAQSYNREDSSPTYQAFRDAYFKRFQRQPGYSAVAAYDAATVLFSALKAQQPEESTKAALLRIGRFPGLQQQISFDRNGDTPRRVFFTEVRNGHFELLPEGEDLPQRKSWP
ncbi:MAG: hypothetical protein RIR00_162 [Pseudomonadota bacterium]|jgi:branched-chain amino acid transport system substrate-binding protein